MNVLWVLAHPDRRSLTGALCDEGVRALTDAGHPVEVSDLYAMGWKAAVDRDDFGDGSAERCIPDERVSVARQSKRAYESGTLSADIRAEHDKIDRADLLVFQFPLWWYSMPAILKGWFDRVFVKGFAYGVTDGSGRTLRYGEGALSGKRALVVLTSGSREPALGPRGINGQLDQVLFPILHGTLWYVGISVLPPVAVYGADRVDGEEYDAAAAMLRDRLASIESTPPLRYRFQNGGDYDDDLVLRAAIDPGATGLGVHRAD